MWPFSKKEDEDSAATIQASKIDEPDEDDDDSETEDSGSSHDSIGRYKIKKVRSLEYKEVLDKSRTLFGYKPRNDYRLDQTLQELDIECLDGDAVRAYQKSKTKNGFAFVDYDIEQYSLDIPIHVLNKMIQIKERIPDATFTVQNYERRGSNAGDPFLWVYVGGWGRCIEVWDEPKFEGRTEPV